MLYVGPCSHVESFCTHVTQCGKHRFTELLWIPHSQSNPQFQLCLCVLRRRSTRRGGNRHVTLPRDSNLAYDVILLSTWTYDSSPRGCCWLLLEETVPSKFCSIYLLYILYIYTPFGRDWDIKDASCGRGTRGPRLFVGPS